MERWFKIGKFVNASHCVKKLKERKKTNTLFWFILSDAEKAWVVECRVWGRGRVASQFLVTGKD